MMNRAIAQEERAYCHTPLQKTFCLLFSAFGLLLPWLLASCALFSEEPPRRDSDDLRRQIRENERSQAEMKSRLDELQNRFEMLEARVKEVQTRLNKLEAKGPVEEAMVEPPLAADKKMREQDIIVPSSSALAPAPPPGKEVPVGAPATPPETRSPSAPEKYYAAKDQTSPRPPEKIEITVLGASQPKMLYDEAFRNYMSGNYSRARGLFQDFAQKFPQDRLAPNALYWLGECFYDQRSYQEALTAFQKVVDLYPQSLKAPDALYKKGICYQDLKQGERAAEEFKAVLNKYPKSEAAKLAQEKLSGLATGQRR